MTRVVSDTHVLSRLFRGMTEWTFMNELGIGDPGLVGYVSDLLTRFVPSEGVWAIRDRQGRALDEVAEMLAEAENATDAERRKACHRHVGDYALFWTGVYPEALSKRTHRASRDGLIDYCQQGKHSYYVASTFDGQEAPVLRRLSVEFELCAYGLSKVRKEWEKPDSPLPPGRLLGT